MRALVQRVRHAQVTMAGENIGHIGAGLLVFLGIAPTDAEREVRYLVGKLSKLRIFPDEVGLMNLSVQQTGLEVLVVSQFTLYGDCSKGNRPSFTGAARPEHAEPLYESFLKLMEKEIGKPVFSGRFGADMEVHLTNWGPVTLWLDSN